MTNPAQRNRRTFTLVLLACLAVSLICVVYPIYVIRPFRHQGARELAVALVVARFRAVTTVIAALTAVLDYAFDTLRLNKVVAETQRLNAQSVRLLERIGMALEKSTFRFGAAQSIYAITAS